MHCETNSEILNVTAVVTYSYGLHMGPKAADDFIWLRTVLKQHSANAILNLPDRYATIISRRILLPGVTCKLLANVHER
jgi:hypothetical protein